MPDHTFLLYRKIDLLVFDINTASYLKFESVNSQNGIMEVIWSHLLFLEEFLFSNDFKLIYINIFYEINLMDQKHT